MSEARAEHECGNVAHNQLIRFVGVDLEEQLELVEEEPAVQSTGRQWVRSEVAGAVASGRSVCCWSRA